MNNLRFISTVLNPENDNASQSQPMQVEVRRHAEQVNDEPSSHKPYILALKQSTNKLKEALASAKRMIERLKKKKYPHINQK